MEAEKTEDSTNSGAEKSEQTPEVKGNFGPQECAENQETGNSSNKPNSFGIRSQYRGHYNYGNSASMLSWNRSSHANGQNQHNGSDSFGHNLDGSQIPINYSNYFYGFNTQQNYSYNQSSDLYYNQSAQYNFGYGNTSYPNQSYPNMGTVGKFSYSSITYPSANYIYKKDSSSVGHSSGMVPSESLPSNNPNLAYTDVISHNFTNPAVPGEEEKSVELPSTEINSSNKTITSETAKTIEEHSVKAQYEPNTSKSSNDPASEFKPSQISNVAAKSATTSQPIDENHTVETLLDTLFTLNIKNLKYVRDIINIVIKNKSSNASEKYSKPKKIQFSKDPEPIYSLEHVSKTYATTESKPGPSSPRCENAYKKRKLSNSSEHESNGQFGDSMSKVPVGGTPEKKTQVNRIKSESTIEKDTYWPNPKNGDSISESSSTQAKVDAPSKSEEKKSGRPQRKNPRRRLKEKLKNASLSGTIPNQNPDHLMD